MLENILAAVYTAFFAAIVITAEILHEKRRERARVRRLAEAIKAAKTVATTVCATDLFADVQRLEADLAHAAHYLSFHGEIGEPPMIVEELQELIDEASRIMSHHLENIRRASDGGSKPDSAMSALANIQIKQFTEAVRIVGFRPFDGLTGCLPRTQGGVS